MIKWWKRRWLRAKTLSILQHFYELPLKEPLDRLADATVQEAVNNAYNNHGNEWDAAAAYVYVVAVGVVGSQNEIRGADHKAVTNAVQITNTYQWMKRPDSIRPLVRDLIQRWNNHPDHPSTRSGGAS